MMEERVEKCTVKSENAMLDYVKEAIKFRIFKSEGWYVAEAADFAIVTQGKTLDELAANIQEAVEVTLEGEDLAKFDLVPNPKILAHIELEPDLRAKA